MTSIRRRVDKGDRIIVTVIIMGKIKARIRDILMAWKTILITLKSIVRKLKIIIFLASIFFVKTDSTIRVFTAIEFWIMMIWWYLDAVPFSPCFWVIIVHYCVSMGIEFKMQNRNHETKKTVINIEKCTDFLPYLQDMSKNNNFMHLNKYSRKNNYSFSYRNIHASCDFF